MDDLVERACSAAYGNVAHWDRLPAAVKMRHCQGMKRAFAVVAEWLDANQMSDSHARYWANAIRQQIAPRTQNARDLSGGGHQGE